MTRDIPVVLSDGNWQRVLDRLKDHARRLNVALGGDLLNAQERRVTFIEREELLGVIEQIEDQLR